jgi:hypothetical protein
MSIEIKTAFLPNEPILKIGEKLGLARSKCVFLAAKTMVKMTGSNPIRERPHRI